MDVSIPKELQDFVREQVESGQYKSEDDVCRDGLRLLKEQQAQYTTKLDALRKEIDIGVKQLDNGEGRPFDKERIIRIAKSKRTPA